MIDSKNSEDQINKLLELISVHNLVETSSPSLANMSYSMSKSGAYNGIFMGDGVVHIQHAAQFAIP